MTKLIVANWKLNPITKKEAITLARSSDFKHVVIAPPFPFLEDVKKVLKKASLGAQDVFFKSVTKGPFTGEVSATMLKKLGVRYVIVGHSERRAMGETDAVVNKKVKAALDAGLKVILCVGENKAVRRRGVKKAEEFVRGQLAKALKGIKSKKNIVIAYEPIWAIGTGRNDKPEEIAVIVRSIKRTIHANVLYGGSVKPTNIASIISRGGVQGALVGGASLKKKDFRKIVSAVNK